MTYPKIDKPTVPGWYWATYKIGGYFDEPEIVRWSQNRSVQCLGTDEYFFESEFADWFGPLPEPTE